MSSEYDSLATVKLTKPNTKAVDARVKKEKELYRIPVSRAAVANKAIAVGIRHLNGRKK